MKHRSGSEDVCRLHMYMPESNSVVQAVRRNSSLELPVGHDLLHLTFKPEQYAETHRIVRGKFKNSAAYEKLPGNLENHRQIRGKRAQNDNHAWSWSQCERDGHKRMAAWSPILVAVWANPEAMRWSIRFSSVDTFYCSGPDSTDIVKTSLLACS